VKEKKEKKCCNASSGEVDIEAYSKGEWISIEIRAKDILHHRQEAC